ncbi:type IX secretion system membrane protein PorP/SprF [Puteibacter caeruleilacunae]|nr:type IX secretion system membrane protein PorP/SprF [Puteibacter caeruleilacunae]
MKKFISFLFLLIIVNLAAIAQQDPQFSQNMLTHIVVNPGSAGANEVVNGSIISRIQWAGFEGAPKTNVFAVDAPLRLFGQDSGLGLTVMSDELGVQEDVAVNLSYAYRRVYNTGSLGIGFSLGFYNYSVDPTKASQGDVDVNSVYIPKEKISEMLLDVGFGAFYKHRDYYIGASARHLNQPEVENTSTVVYYLSRHYYLTAGYNIDLTSPLFELQPSIFFKFDGTTTQLDLNCNLMYDKKYWGGLSYRLNEGPIVMLGTELANGIRIGYAFDLTSSEMNADTFGSHEFFIGYSLSLQKRRSNKYKSIRYL